MIDLTGKLFNKFVVINQVNNDKNGNIQWLCLCDCGKEKIILGSNLKSGDIQSCGCLRREKTTQRFTRHKHSQLGKISKTYKSWACMIQRCTNPNNHAYSDYGGRGIKVCQRWLKFENFLEDIGELPTNKHSIDRINNNGNYCKSNCRWVTQKQQTRNTRRNRLISYNGKVQCLCDWAKEIGINPKTLQARIFRYNWSIKRALITSAQKREK